MANWAECIFERTTLMECVGVTTPQALRTLLDQVCIAAVAAELPMPEEK